MRNTNTENLILIRWEGPLSLEEVQKRKTEEDYGLYQIYGQHALYGSDVLIYIGIASERTFGIRIPEHRENWLDYTPDPKQVKVYVGRLVVRNQTMSEEERKTKTAMAEKLLIYAHCPAANTSNKNGLPEEAFRYHVINFDSYRSLMGEVSGLAWGPIAEEMKDAPVFRMKAKKSAA